MNSPDSGLLDDVAANGVRTAKWEYRVESISIADKPSVPR